MPLAAAYAVRWVFAVVFLAITACGDGKSREGRQPAHDSASADRNSPRGLVQWKFGRIDRVERPHTGLGHKVPHINYTTARGRQATLEVQSVGREFRHDGQRRP